MWGTRLKRSVVNSAVDLATQPQVCAEAARFAQLLVCIRSPEHPCANHNSVHLSMSAITRASLPKP